MLLKLMKILGKSYDLPNPKRSISFDLSNFYDLYSISEYLANAFNNSNGVIPKCPMRIDLPDELITDIYHHHYCEETKSLDKFSKSSMQSCLFFTTSKNREEYNKLIKSW